MNSIETYKKDFLLYLKEAIKGKEPKNYTNQYTTYYN